MLEAAVKCAAASTKLLIGLGASMMRTLRAVCITLVLCITLGGCWTSGQDATSKPSSDRFVGQKVDAVVSRFGQPTGRKKLDGDQMLYIWELPSLDWSGNKKTYSGPGGLYGDGQTPGHMSDDPRMCKLSVTTSPEGIVTQVDAEDSNGTGAPAVTLGFSGSVCAQRLSATR